MDNTGKEGCSLFMIQGGKAVNCSWIIQGDREFIVPG